MKILVSDFDETFYTLQYEQNVEMVKQFIAKGNIFIIATGRNLEQLLLDLVDYEIPISYYICNDGAMIYDENLKQIYRKDIKQEIVKEIFNKLDEKHYYREIWLDHGSEYSIDSNLATNKIIARPKDRKKANEIFKKIEIDYPEIVGYFSRDWLNIVDVSVNKGNAIHFLQMKNGWLGDDIYTVGDSDNDLSMITMYRGYAVANACDNVKKVSIKTIPTFQDILTIIENEKNRN